MPWWSWMLIWIVLGCFIDWIGILLLTAPIFVPVAQNLGFDLVWLGVLFCMNMQISYISPPFGPAAFYLKGVTPPDITLGHIFKSIWPYLALQAIAPLLEDKIRSRRLAFALAVEDDDETQIAVIHVQTDEELGFIFAEDGEYVFESNLEAYFDDFVDDDPERFVDRLYETLRADLPKYEVENKG